MTKVRIFLRDYTGEGRNERTIDNVSTVELPDNMDTMSPSNHQLLKITKIDGSEAVFNFNDVVGYEETG